MELLKRTLDLADERDELKERLDELEAEQERLVEEANEIDGSDDPEDIERFEQIEEQDQQIEALIVATRGYLEVVERALKSWDGTEIVIRELSGAEVRSIEAEAQQRAEQVGLDNYSDRFHEVLMLEKSIESTPPGCPDPGNIGDLPNRLLDWLHTRTNALNSTGDFDMGNSSLREKMIRQRGEK